MQLPYYPIPTRQTDALNYLWDVLRKKWVVETPEEGVRQRLVHYLLQEKKISPALIGIEKMIQVYTRKKRFDLVVFDKEGKPFLLCECKRPEIALSQETLTQAGEYNLVLGAPFLVLTNGNDTRCFEVKEGFEELEF
jgi:hypothetical protein